MTPIQTCPDESVFQDLLSGALPEETQAGLAAHLETCPTCQAALDTLAGSELAEGAARAPNPSDDATLETALRVAMKSLKDDSAARPAEDTAEEYSLSFLDASDDPQYLGRLGHYHVREVIGAGGMGVVLRALDETLHRTVAIKVLSPQLAANSTARKRFQREAIAAAAVSHDHVVTIHAVEELNGQPYLVMEYVNGLSLAERIERSGPLELKEILRIGLQIASGLEAAHKQGLIHRDIKPANILLENGVERVKITDFGLARAVDDIGMTQTGVVAGTPQYMSPEQAHGEHVGQRTDLFSLGCVLYAMCTGRSPFRASSTLAVIKRVCEDTPKPIAQVNPEIPAWLVDIINRLLAKDPSARFQTTGEVADILGQYLAHVQQPHLIPLPDPAHLAGRTPSHSPVAPLTTKAAQYEPTIELARPSPRRYQRRLIAAATTLLLLMGLFTLTEATGVTQLASTVIRVVTGTGVLVIEVDDPSIGVTIDGEEVVITGAGVHEIRLKPGEHRILAEKNGVPLQEKLITITRGGKEVVRISRQNSVVNNPADGEGFIPLFNGKDLTGWKYHPDQPGEWRVVSGILTGTGRQSHLFSERGDYQDFHLRVEAKVDDGADGGICFRTGFDLKPIGEDGKFGKQPGGYEAQIMHHGYEHKTGSLFCIGKPVVYQSVNTELYESPVHPGEWFVLEIIARDGRLTILVNGKSTAATLDNRTLYSKGHIVLQHLIPGRKGVHFRKIEIKELPASNQNGPPSASALYQLEKLSSIKLPTDGHRFALSPDRMLLATGLMDGRLLLWDFETHQLRFELQRQSPNVWVTAFSPDGAKLLSVAGEGSQSAIVLWDVATGKKIRDLTGPTEMVETAAFSPDGRMIAAGDHSGDLHIWDASTGEHRQRIDAGEHWVLSVAYSPNGELIASASGSVVNLWDASSGELKGELTGHGSPVQVVRFSPGGKHIASGDQSGEVRLWGTKTGRQQGVTIRYSNSAWVYHIALSADSRFLAASGLEGTKVYDQESRRLLCQTPEKGQVAFTPSGDALMTGTWDHDPQGSSIIIYKLPEALVKRNVAENGPFVILAKNGQADRMFPTLTDAVAAVQSGDVIEIRGDGPFECEPILIRNRSLTIRSGGGVRPILKVSSNAMQGISPLLHSNAKLVLEGLEFQRVGVEPWDVEGSPFYFVFSQEAPIHVANCRFLVDVQPRTASARHLIGGIRAWESPVCEVRNCEATGRDLEAVLDWICPPTGQMALDNCVKVGGVTPGYAAIFHPRYSSPDGLSVQITRNTLLQNQPIACFYERNPTPFSADPTGIGRPIRVDVSENVFKTEDCIFAFLYQYFIDNPKLQQLPDEVATSLPASILTWSEQRNLYPPNSRFLAFHAPKPIAMVGASTQLSEWNRYWGLTDTGSIQDRIRFRGGDLRTALTVQPAKLTPADFRLADGSPGKGAGEGGRDLGADVDLVGPGAAYQRFKQAPEYQQWLVETGQSNTPQLEELARFDVPPLPSKIAISPNGKLFATGHENGRLLLWDFASREKRFELKGHDEKVCDVEFSPDGTKLLSVSSDWQRPDVAGKVFLWDAQAGTKLREYTGHKSPTFSASFAPDGQTFVTGSQGGAIRLWNVSTGEVSGSFPKSEHSIHSLEFLADGATVAAGGDGAVTLWDVGTRQVKAKLTGHSGEVQATCLSRDGRLLASGSRDGTIRMWDTKRGRQQGPTIRYSDSKWVFHLSLSRENRILAASGIEGTKLYDVQSGSLLCETTEEGTCAFSPTDDTLISCHWGEPPSHIVVWKLPEEFLADQPIRLFTGHTAHVDWVDFSPDGKLAASASWDQSVCLWDVASGQRLHRLTEGNAPAKEVQFSPDGAMLAAMCDDVDQRTQVLCVWKVADGKLVHRLTKGRGYFDGIAFLPDGKQIVTAGAGKIRFWDSTNGLLKKAANCKDAHAEVLKVSPDGRRLAIAFGDRTLRVYDVQQLEELFHIDTKEMVRTVDFSPDSRLVAFAGEDKTIGLYEVATGAEVRMMAGYSQAVMSIDFSPDGRFILAGAHDGTWRIRETATGRELLRRDVRGLISASVAFAPNGEHVLTAGGYEKFGGDYAIRLWKLPPEFAPPRPVRLFSGHTAAIDGVDISPDGKLAASGSWDKTVNIWELDTGELLHRMTGHSDRIMSVRFSTDGSQLVSASQADPTTCVWDVQSGKLLHSFSARPRASYGAAFVPGSAKIVSAGGEDVAYLDTSTGQALDSPEISADGKERHQFIARSMAVSPDTNWLACGWRRLRLYNLASGDEVHNLAGTSAGLVNSVQFSPDSRHIVSGSGDKIVRIHEVKSGEEVLRLEGHTGDISCVDYSPDGRYIASAAWDKTWRIWDSRSGEELYKVHTDKNSHVGITFAPDGRHVLTGGGYGWPGGQRDGDYALRLWKLPEALLPSDDVAEAH